MLIDVNTNLGHWPFQKFLVDAPAKLSSHLISEGISLALVSPLENVFYPGPDAYNKLLFKKLKPYPNLMPVAVINPTLSDWKERLEEYTDFQEIRAVKIFPNYHNYLLSSQNVKNLMNELARRKLPLIIQMRLEDERGQYPLLKVAGVDYREIIKSARHFPEVSIVCLCPYLSEAIAMVKNTADVYIDISFTETLNTIDTLVKNIPAKRIVFGSHTPFLYTRSAVMKIKAAKVPKEDLRLIISANARRIFNINSKKERE